MITAEEAKELSSIVDNIISHFDQETSRKIREAAEKGETWVAVSFYEIEPNVHKVVLGLAERLRGRGFQVEMTRTLEYEYDCNWNSMRVSW